MPIAETAQEMLKKVGTVPTFDPKDHDRLTVQLSLVHEHCGDAPFAVQSQFSDVLSNIEQPYSRRQKVSLLWQHLDLGWIEKPGLIIIQNTTGVGGLVNLSQEEKEELKNKYLLVGSSDQQIVRPGRFFYGEFVDPRQVEIKAACEGVSITVHVLPKD